MKKGFIVSIQGFSKRQTKKLCDIAKENHAVAIRTDKKVKTDLNIIGLIKIKTRYPRHIAYITPCLSGVKKVSKWADYIAIDYRRCNKNLDKINSYIKKKRLHVIADIQNLEDYKNIKKKNYIYDYIATTFNVFNNDNKKNKLISDMVKFGEKNIIAEGGYFFEVDIKTALSAGAKAVCIGAGVFDITKRMKCYGEFINEFCT